MHKVNRSAHRLVRLGFILLTVAALLSGFLRAAFFPQDLNTYESRPANQLPALTLSGFSSLTFQDEAESALSDQLPLSQYFKKAYNSLKYLFLEHTAFPIMSAAPDRYYYFSDLAMFNDMLVNLPESPESSAAKITPVIASFNKAAAENPEAEFFFYYVENDHDIDFETGVKTGLYDYVSSICSIPDSHMACYEINSFSDYARTYYDTDHHWQYLGSYEGYKQILRLLGCADAPLEPVEERSFPHPWRGSKANTLGFDTMTETFSAYRFAFPPMEYVIEGRPAEDYGRQQAFFDHPDGVVTYGNFYGDNYSEAIIRTGQTEKENLLIVGDSFTHAILKLLASHYGNTYLLDPRHYALDQETLSAYIEQHDISKVLFVNYYATLCDERFLIGG